MVLCYKTYENLLANKGLVPFQKGEAGMLDSILREKA